MARETVSPSGRVLSVHDERDPECIGILDASDFQLLQRLGLLRPVRRTANGQVTEYAFSHTLRTLLERTL